MSVSPKKSANESGKQPDDWFDLPDPGYFDSVRRPVPPDLILKYSEDQLPYVTSRPGFHERRLATKVDVPFEM